MRLPKLLALPVIILLLNLTLLPVHAVQQAPALSADGVLTIGPDAPAEDRFFESEGWQWDGDTLTLSPAAGGRVRAVHMNGGTIRLMGSLALNSEGLDSSFGYALVNASEDPVTIQAGSHTLTLMDSSADSPCLTYGPITIAGGTVTILGSAESDITLTGSTARLTVEQIGVTELCSLTVRRGTARIGGSVGNLTVQGGSVQIDGHVLGDLTAEGGTITVAGTVEGAYSVSGGSVSVNGQAITPDTSQNTPTDPDPLPTHTHSWSQTWSGSETHHWHECLTGDCPITQDEEKEGYAAHTGGAATCTDWAMCAQCSMEYGQLSEHTYDQANTAEQYLLTSATHSQPAVYLMSCVCGEAGVQTFQSGQSLGHTFSDVLIWDETGHWQACDCGERQRFQPHTPGQSCTLCGYTAPTVPPVTPEPPSGDPSGSSSGNVSDPLPGGSSGDVSDVPSGGGSGDISDVPSGGGSADVSDTPSGGGSGDVSDVPSGGGSTDVSDTPSGGGSGNVSDAPSGDSSHAVPGGSSDAASSTPSPTPDHSGGSDSGSQVLFLDVIMYGSAVAALALLAFVVWITIRPKRP